MAVSSSGRAIHDAVETEALSQRIITEVVRDALEAHLPQPLEKVQALEEAERHALKAHFLVTNPPLIEKPEVNPEEPEIASSHY